jgi:SAM-dependent methyltransferase
MTSRWQQLAGDDAVEGYDSAVAARLAHVGEAGGTIHAEAELVADLCRHGGTVLDAGCGTGRVTWRLVELGYAVVGVDSDPRMLSRARDDPRGRRVGMTHARRPCFVETDLATYRGKPVDLVVAAGNVVPLLSPGTLHQGVQNLADQLRPEGHLVWGFGLRKRTLPDGCPPTPLRQVEHAARQAGLRRVHRWGTWERGAFTGEYVVEVYAPAGTAPAAAAPDEPTPHEPVG